VSAAPDRLSPAVRVYELLEGDEPHFDDLAWYREKLGALRGPVLELAAGTGRVTRTMQAHHGETVALDLDAQMLRCLRARTPGLRGIVQADLRRLPFRGSSAARGEGPPFAAIVCAYNSLGCLVDRMDLRRAFAEMRRVLWPAGSCLFDVGRVHPADLPEGSKTFDVETWALPDGDRLSRQVRIHHLPDEECVRIDTVYEESRPGRPARIEHVTSSLNTWPLEVYLDAALRAGFALHTLDERRAPPAEGGRPRWAFVALTAP